jgi:mRNA interferase MazF
MKRGEIYFARLEPVEGLDQGGTRPVIIVSRDVINNYSPVVLGVPCTTYREGNKIYPTQVLLKKSEGGLNNDSIAMADQVRVLSKNRLMNLVSILDDESINKLNKALAIALDLW